MYRIVIWGTGKAYNRTMNLIKFYEIRGDFKVVGVFSNNLNIPNQVDGYPFFNKNVVKDLDFDYCVVAFEDFDAAREEAPRLGILPSCLIPFYVLSIPHFDFESYILLRDSRLSIFAPLCWGGICYNTFGLQALSPTINMFFEHSGKDYLKFLRNLDEYLSAPFEFFEDAEDRERDVIFPVCTIGDIKLYCNHYASFEEARAAWERRKKRVNKENLLIMHYTDNVEIAEAFEELPYEHKIIFTTFDSDLKSIYNLAGKRKISWMDFTTLVNRTAFGERCDIDLLKLFTHKGDYIRIC